jgi:hypothetical protein
MRHARVVVPHYGGPEVITTIEEDNPAPKAGQVRVKVLAAGVSLPDVLAREGVHPETPRVPYTPGDAGDRDAADTHVRSGTIATADTRASCIPPRGAAWRVT